MRILAYGEDALTLWALQNRMGQLLRALGEDCCPRDCTVIYRPSFGRRGSKDGPQLGEFDFVLLSPKRLHLGESKWSRSSLQSDAKGAVMLDDRQLRRHEMLHFYIREWFRFRPCDWSCFLALTGPTHHCRGLDYKLAQPTHLLARNIEGFLRLLAKHYECEPDVHDVLLYLITEDAAAIPTGVANAPEFGFMKMDCADAMAGSHVQLVP